MQFMLFVFIFCLILFLYLHIFYHLKISKDLEVYSAVNPTKSKLEEICDIRQPVIFTLDQPILTNIDLSYLQKNYGAFDINIISHETDDTNNVQYTEPVPFIMNEAIEFLNLDADDTNKGFISYRNKEYLEETTLVKTFRRNDYFLRPQFVSLCDYDIMIGCKKSITKTQYDLNYRNYYMCLDGSVTIRVVSPTYKKYMDHQTNYADFEFYSPLNIWDIQPGYKNVFDKIKTMDITLHKGDVVYIPAYWYYSIRFDSMALLATFKYRTYMNSLAISPELFVYFLQNNNIKRHTYSKYLENNKVKDDNENDDTE